MRPRRITAGQLWFTTRRTTRRHLLLRPDSDGTSQAIYCYTTAVLAKKFGVRIHAVQVMSTHIHEVLTDTRGELPNFIRERNRALANALKCHRGWPEEVFQRAPASCVEVHGPRAILRQIAYTIANCVEAGLVESPSEWPGVSVSADEIGTRVVRVERPAIYFDPENEVWPAVATLAIEMPEDLVAEFGAGATSAVRGAVDNAVARARRIARAAGRAVAGVRRIFGVSFRRRASSFESFGARNPSFAAGGDATFARYAYVTRRAFLVAYRRALDLWKRGVDRPHFPPGSWRWCRELLGPTTVEPAKISMSVGSPSPLKPLRETPESFLYL